MESFGFRIKFQIEVLGSKGQIKVQDFLMTKFFGDLRILIVSASKVYMVIFVPVKLRFTRYGYGFPEDMLAYRKDS